MGRILFKKAPPGYRNVSGMHIISLQRGLVQSAPIRPVIDGDYGGRTEESVKSWQSERHREPTGAVDAADWSDITNLRPPSLFLRCLSLTARFEGHGYTIAAGNWDKAYVTWGIIGFTLAGGNLQKVLSLAGEREIEQAISRDKCAELMDICNASPAAQQKWADRISRDPKKYTLRADWQDAFRALGEAPALREAQHTVARDIYWAQAISDVKTYGEMTERDAALFFDTAVQNGGVSGKGDGVKRALRRLREPDEATRLSAIADAIADQSKSSFRDDVRSRRRAIATGVGDVHGARYMIEGWGLAPNAPITEEDFLDPPARAPHEPLAPIVVALALDGAPVEPLPTQTPTVEPVPSAPAKIVEGSPSLGIAQRLDLPAEAPELGEAAASPNDSAPQDPVPPAPVTPAPLAVQPEPAQGAPEATDIAPLPAGPSPTIALPGAIDNSVTATARPLQADDAEPASTEKPAAPRPDRPATE